LSALSEGFSEDRLSELAERWERDPSSRIFLQLAEEYRRAGQLEKAVEALERGLQSHPSYLSALVALGRCRLELDRDASAVEALEQAVVYDPAQLVANKLLVEAYLRTGQAAKARERLEFYRLFNDRDEEIEALEQRIAEAGAAAPAAPVAETASGAEPAAPAAARPAELPRARTSGEVFDLVGAAPRTIGLEPPRRPDRPQEPFGPLGRTGRARRRIALAFAEAGLFPAAVPPEAVPVAPAPAPEPPPPAAAAPVAVPETPAESVPPPELVPAAEPEPPASRPAAETMPPAAPSRPPWGVGTRAAEVEFDAREEVVAAPFSPRTIGEEVESEVIEEPFDEVLEAGSAASAMPRTPAPEEEAEPVAEEVAAAEAERASRGSSTLGELYLSQGHLDEAEEQFRLVLEVRPEDAGALAGLAAIAERRAAATKRAAPPVAVSAAAAAAPRAAAPAPGGLTRRKLETLRSYLERLRRSRGEGARVS
jgi:tetratricopeptide (TPR) repeat protein